MKNLHIRSFAKINISLNITKKRKDGFHELDSVMLPISLHDSLVVSRLNNAANSCVTVDDFSIGTFSYNLATFSIEKLQSVYHFDDKFRIFIHKVIPIQAGLGGGSSNAAFTMKAVNQMLKLGATDEELIELGKTLGCDIPFFIKCKPARVQGVGEILTPITIKNNYYVLLVKPELGCSTKEVYGISDTMKLKTGNIDNVIKALEDGDDELLAANISNALQEPAIQLVPAIQSIIDELKENGLKMVQVTGSGSAVFALSTNKKQLVKVFKKLEDRYEVELAKVMK
jgi:4-diphosphocytidyl-2C-methyl-D-erythritol kinase